MSRLWRLAGGATAAIAIALTAAGQQQFPALEKGFRPDKLYQFGSVDCVNVFSGTVLINLPIGPDYALDGGMTYGLRLSYNSKPWDFSVVEGYVHAHPSIRSNAGMGWIIGMGRLIPWDTPGNLSFVELYEAPDGGDHPFYLSGGAPCVNPCTTFPRYTYDGSNLRMRSPTATVREIDFPDGVIKKFVANSSGEWDLREIRNIKSNDVISITYGQGGTSGCSAGTDSYWAINDTRGRNHLVCFTTRLVNSIERPMVDRVVLSKQGRQLIYQFGYVAMTLPKPAEDTDHTSTVINAWRQTHDVQLLDTLTLPDGSKYQFTLGNGDVLGAMTLPTLGKISYQYESWYVPSTNICDDSYFPGIGLGGFAHGVSQRTFIPAVPAGQTPVTRTWQYARELRPGSTTPDYMSSRICEIQIVIDPDIVPDPVPMHVQLYDELVVTVTDPLGHKVGSHFSVWPGDDTGRAPDPDTSPAGFRRRHYGYPYGRHDVAQDRYLSQEMFDCTGACALKRSVWVRHDPVFSSVEPLLPSRLASQSTVFHDDPLECVAEGTAANCGISFSDSTDWDNYGHYRQISSNLRFDNKTDLRTVNTAWNGTAAAPRTIAAGDPWVLITYESSTTTEGSVTSVEQACFDLSTGFLEAARTLAGITPASSDLAVLYESLNGNVSAEKYYGGDVTPLASNAPIFCTALSAIAATTPAYRINHEWQNAQLAKSQHAGMTFFSRDLTIDLDGLVTSSRDMSGLQTNYSYDANWRLSSASPPGQAQTTYTYSNALPPRRSCRRRSLKRRHSQVLSWESTSTNTTRSAACGGRSSACLATSGACAKPSTTNWSGPPRCRNRPRWRE